MALKITGFGVYEVTVSRLCGRLDHSRCFYTCMQPCLPLASLNDVDDALRNMVPNANEPLVNAVFWFL